MTRSLRRLLSAAVLATASLALAPAFAQTLAQTAVQTAVPSRIVARIDNASRVTLSGTMHPLARAANDHGLAPDSTPLQRVHLTFKRSDAQQAALKQLITDLHNSASPSFHQWLTPEQFGKQFGPSDADLAQVQAWLGSQGLTVTKVNPGRQSLEFSGTAGQFRQAFHADIHQYQVAGQMHFANAQEPQIPAALAPVVDGFSSLNNFPLKNYSKLLGKAQYQPASGKVTPSWTQSGSTFPNFILSPADYAIQYNLKPLYAAGTTGAGQTIAIINEANINVYLVNQFRSLFSLPVNPPQIILDGEDPGIDGINNIDGQNGASVEAYLDVEWAGAVAPNATVDLVIAADTALQSGLILAAEHAVYGNIAPVLSLSFGSCESAIGAGENAFLSSLWQQAAAQGQTVLVSSGDAGSAGCDNDNTQAYATQGQAVNGFASTPYNLAVGGTDFYYSQYNAGTAAINLQLQQYWNQTATNNTPTPSLLGVIPEQPWNDSQYGLNIYNTYTASGSTSIAAGSGGASTCATGAPATGTAASTCKPYSKPSWQVGTGVPADSARDIPDVSLFASNGQNASFYPICGSDGDCQAVPASGTVQIEGIGGTSASTPSFAGIMALINQKYGRQGQAAYTLYPLAQQFPAAFHDVVNGTNTVPCATGSPTCIAVPSPITINGVTEGEIGVGTTPEYNAGTGYDLATGLGTVDANVLVANWNKVVFAGSTTTLTPSSTSFAHGTAITLAGTVKSTGSSAVGGSVTLATDNTEALQQSQTVLPVTAGAFSGSYSLLPGGTYNVYGVYGGDGVNAPSTSAKTSITVTPETSGVAFTAYDFNQKGAFYFGTAPTQALSYGESFALSANPVPAAQVAAETACKTSGGTCPTFSPATGTVTFTDNGATINTGVVNAEGEAEFSYGPSVGTHSVNAAYAGDKSYSSSTGTAFAFTVARATPVFQNIAASNVNASNQITGGQQTVLTVQLENSVGATGFVLAPTGTINVSGAPTGTPTTATLVTGTDPSNGAPVSTAAILIPAGVTAGNYNITLTYPGDTNYTAATTGYTIPFAAAGTQLPSTTTAVLSATATSPAALTTFTITVTGKSGSATPTGTINVEDGPYGLGTLTLVNGIVSFGLNSQSLLQGGNILTFQYSGDGNYLGSAATANVANPLSDFSLAPTLSVVTVPASGMASDLVSVSSISGFAGTVALTCTAPAGVTCTTSQASATVATGGSASTTLNFTATVAGTFNVLLTGKDASGHFIHTAGIQLSVAAITPVPVPNFTLSSASGITIANPGASGTGTVNVTPFGGFTGSVALTCAITSSPAGATFTPTCTITNPVVVSGTTSVPATLTINTTAPTTGRLDLPSDFFHLDFLHTAGATALAALVCFLIPGKRRRWTSLLGVLAVSLILGLASGCGGSGGSTGTPPVPVPPGTAGTTLGSYTVTVSGTSGSLASSTTVALTVN